MKRANIYQASNYNVTFNPTTMEAHSYRWWRFVAKIEGLVVFNPHRYSVTTSKHQQKVRSLMDSLGIGIDLELPLQQGITMDSLSDLIVRSEEELCDQFLYDQLKKQDRYQRQKFKKRAAKLTEYLETQVHFRDYEIKPVSQFGTYNKIAVHQVVEPKTLESDVANALYNFQRDGFGEVVLYV